VQNRNNLGLAVFDNFMKIPSCKMPGKSCILIPLISGGITIPTIPLAKPASPSSRNDNRCKPGLVGLVVTRILASNKNQKGLLISRHHERTEEDDITQPLKRRPILVTDLASAGTLAAVRVFGRAGLQVTVGGSSWLAAARWSRFAAQHWHGATGASERVAQAVLGKWANRSQGHVLLAASDEMAWMFSHYKTELEKSFLVYVPDAQIIDSILDKQKLTEACVAAGIATIPTWFPRDLDAVNALSETLPYPILIKPRRHVFRVKHDKGFVVDDASALLAQFGWIAEREHERTIYSENHPRPMPLLQQFIPDAVENVVSVSGFIDRSGTRFMLRSSRKIMQRSRPVGIGLAFESINLDPALAQVVITLCTSVGYYGIFEVEFVYFNNQWCLIDFNPRFYHQMALDVKSGAPLPLLAYFDACDDFVRLDRAICSSTNAVPAVHYGFRDAATVCIVLLTRLLFSRSRASQKLPSKWTKKMQIIDAAFDRKDPLPWLIHAMSEIRLGVLAVPRLIRITRQRNTHMPLRQKESQA